MLCDAELFLELDERENDVVAEVVARALRVDDPEWCKTEANGSKVVVRIRTERIESLLSACEDYFRTIRAAIGTLEALNCL